MSEPSRSGKMASRELPTYREAMGDKATDFPKVFGPYSHEELQKAFDGIVNKDDWRDTIDGWVPISDAPVVEAAIAYFTSTQPVQEEKNEDLQTVRITSPGYRNGPAGP